MVRFVFNCIHFSILSSDWYTSVSENYYYYYYYYYLITTKDILIYMYHLLISR
jgi:hypothetical protein